MKKTKLIFKLLLISIVFVSCNKDNADEIIITKNIFEVLNSEVLISSEGNFGGKDGSVSLFSEVASNVFHYNEVNGVKLGGLIQSVTYGDTYVYIILNDVNQIVVVNKSTFLKVSTIETGLSNPRYMAIVGDKGYITNWGSGSSSTDDYVAVLNLSNNTIESTISLAEGVEQIVADDTNLYVTHKGGFSTGNTLSVVEISSKTVSTISLDDQPDELFFNNHGELVVLCEGKTLTYNADLTPKTKTNSSINFINISTKTVAKKLSFSEGMFPSLMYYDNGDIYYYAGGKVYSITDAGTSLSSDVIFEANLYGMAAKKGKLLALKKAFTQLSKLTIVDVISKEVEYETAVGLGASKVYFVE